jgi:hypothetical protein
MSARNFQVHIPHTKSCGPVGCTFAVEPHVAFVMSFKSFSRSMIRLSLRFDDYIVLDNFLAALLLSLQTIFTLTTEKIRCAAKVL